MRLLFAICLALIAVGLIGAHVELEAAHHVQHNKQVLVVQDYAVPVAVPVAPYAGVTYHQPNKSPAPPPQSLEDRIVDKLFARFEAKANGQLNAQGKITQFGVSCAKCHKQDNQFKAPVFLSFETMTDAQLLAAEEAIDDERMPKDKPASPEVAGNLFREIRAVRKARLEQPLKASAEVPPPITESPTDAQGNLKPGWRSVPIEEAIKSGMPPPPGYKSAAEVPPKPEPPPEPMP